MNALRLFLDRLFGRQPRLATFVYTPASQLVHEPETLIEAGVVEPWRTDDSGELWYKSEPGGLEWYRDHVANEANDSSEGTDDD